MGSSFTSTLVDVKTVPDVSTSVNASGTVDPVPSATAPTRALLPLLDEPAALCCPPLAEAPLSEPDAELLASRLKALADPVRLRLLSLVLASGESCVCDLTAPVGLSQPTVSHHLKVLADAGILAREKRGKWAWYRLVPGSLGALAAVIATGPAA